VHKSRRVKVIFIGTLGVAGLAGGILVAGLHQPRATPPQPAGHHARTVNVFKVTAPITIDPHVGETFTPAPSGATPRLTAQQAWAKYAKVAGIKPTIASGVAVRLGLLTLPIGPTGPHNSTAYIAKNELVYGYSWHSCPVSTGLRVTKLPRNPCIQWNFLNANTGRQIDETWQQ
jgi:hypothetical protein